MFSSSRFLLLSFFPLLLIFLFFLPSSCRSFIPHIYRFLVVLFLLFSFRFVYVCSSLRDAFFKSLFLFYVSKFIIKKALFVSFLMIALFWNWDRSCGSYELFSLPYYAFFSFYLFSCIFYFWKTPLTSYPFNFILLLSLEPFILCFILINLSIWCICHGLFL